MELIIYKLFKDDWIETNDLTPHDVALILNKDQKEIYFWVGNRASMKKKVEAKILIGQNKQRFSRYKYFMGNTGMPEEIQAEVHSKLKEESKLKEIRIKDIKKIQWVGIVMAVLAGILMVVNLALISKEFFNNIVEFQDDLHYQIPLDSHSNFYIALIVIHIMSLVFLAVSDILFLINKNYWNAGAITFTIVCALLFWLNYAQDIISVQQGLDTLIREDVYRLFLTNALSLLVIPIILIIITVTLEILNLRKKE